MSSEPNAKQVGLASDAPSATGRDVRVETPAQSTANSPHAPPPSGDSRDTPATQEDRLMQVVAKAFDCVCMSEASTTDALRLGFRDVLRSRDTGELHILRVRDGVGEVCTCGKWERRTGEVTFTEHALTALRADVQRLRDDLTAYRNSYDVMQKTAQYWQDFYNESRAEVQRLREERDELKWERDVLVQGADHLREEIARLQPDLEAATRERDAARLQEAAWYRDADEARADLYESQAECARLREERDDAEYKRKSLLESLRELHEGCNARDVELARLQSALEAAQKDLADAARWNERTEAERDFAMRLPRRVKSLEALRSLMATFDARRAASPTEPTT